jgi:hypothetical protein
MSGGYGQRPVFGRPPAIGGRVCLTAMGNAMIEWRREGSSTL